MVFFSRRKPKFNNVKSFGNWKRTRFQDTAPDNLISWITTCHQLGKKEVGRGITVFRLSKEIDISMHIIHRFTEGKTYYRGNKLVIGTMIFIVTWHCKMRPENRLLILVLLRRRKIMWRRKQRKNVMETKAPIPVNDLWPFFTTRVVWTLAAVG